MEKNKWYMAGTQGTGEYTVVAQTYRGRVGFRQCEKIGEAVYARVRVEPRKGKVLPALSREAGWKQPGDEGQPRYSKMVAAGAPLKAAIKEALVALGVGKLKRVEVNPNAPDWVKELVEGITSV